MALTVRYTIAPPCAGDGHFAVTVIPSAGSPLTFPYSKAEAREPLNQDDLLVTAKVLLRLLVGQIPAGSAAQIKQRIEATTLNLTVAP